VRVTVAVMFHKFVLLIQTARVSQDSKVLAIAKSAATCGQMLLLELLNAAVEDPNLSKELYKKKSLIHRRKVRIWQMLCILSPFITDDMVSKVTVMLDICLGIICHQFGSILRDLLSIFIYDFLPWLKRT
jgi:tRNA guanosine-2'-O-methyltransferase